MQDSVYTDVGTTLDEGCVAGKTCQLHSDLHDFASIALVGNRVVLAVNLLHCFFCSLVAFSIVAGIEWNLESRLEAQGTF